MTPGNETYRLERSGRNAGWRIYTGDNATLSVNGKDARLEISGADDDTDCEEA